MRVVSIISSKLGQVTNGKLANLALQKNSKTHKNDTMANKSVAVNHLTFHGFIKAK